MSLAKSIAADRQRTGMSQADLARLVGVSQQSVAKWESGSATPRGKRLSRLVDALGNSSHTAAQIKKILPAPSNNTHDMGQTTPFSQAQALAALAQAAQDIARAAQALAHNVALLAKADPPDKH